jgi:hypothetical protein
MPDQEVHGDFSKILPSLIQRFPVFAVQFLELPRWNDFANCAAVRFTVPAVKSACGKPVI